MVPWQKKKHCTKQHCLKNILLECPELSVKEVLQWCHVQKMHGIGITMVQSKKT